METLLMDPISALIGGGLGAVSNIVGSMMNTSSQQAINAANLNFAMQQQQGLHLGEYFGNMYAGAQSAGYNPLAVLGVKSPGGGAGQVAPMSGAGVAAGGTALGNAISRIDMETREQDLARKKEENAHIAATTRQTMIDNA